MPLTETNREACEEIKNEINSVEEKLRELNYSNSELKNTIYEKENYLEQNSEKKSQLKQQLYTIEEKIGAKKERRSNLRERIADSKDEYDKNSWTNEVEGLTSEIERLKESRSAFKDQLSSTRYYIEELKNRLVTLRQENGIQQDRKRNIGERLGTLRGRKNELGCDDGWFI